MTCSCNCCAAVDAHCWPSSVCIEPTNWASCGAGAPDLGSYGGAAGVSSAITYSSLRQSHCRLIREPHQSRRLTAVAGYRHSTTVAGYPRMSSCRSGQWIAGAAIKLVCRSGGHDGRVKRFAFCPGTGGDGLLQGIPP